MKALARFVTLGAQDADRRVAAMLAPRSFDGTDAYLMSSATLRFADRLSRRLQDWWRASHTGAAMRSASDAWRREPWRMQYRTIAIVLLVATAAHVGLTLIQGPRPGWFWMMIPVTFIAFGILLLVASRPTPSPN